VPLWRPLLVGAAGLVAAAYGLGVHLAHALIDGPSLADVPGIAVGLAGLALVVHAYRLALRGRGRLAKVLAVLVTLVLLQWFALPVVTGGLVSNAPRGPVDAAATLGIPGARDVRLAAADGTRLAGWLVPGESGAAVVVMHGSHGTRESTADHVRLLARQGHSVLSVDARGHGESGGSTNAAGWTSADDVAGAVAYLSGVRGVDRRRIAALGLSMGGEVMLRAAAEGTPLAAVVADGAGASTLGDAQLVGDGPLPTSVSWLSMRATELFTGDAEPVPLHEAVRGLTAPALLVASGAEDELELDRAFAREIGASAEVWSVPQAGHTEALDVRPREYAARVGRFLDEALR
jgi:pimeloyl-ACP methyl ester carboxylesterase